MVLEIPIDRSVQPIQQVYRRAPIALEERIHEKLKYLLEMDVIEKVKGPSPWVSPLVPVLKQSGDIRLCVDMRRANQAVLRETHPLPVIEELLVDMAGAIKFSKLDVKDAYHQLELSEKSRVLTTFITKYGLFRYKRLMFRISCAPELFQKVMDTIVAGLEGVTVYLDDVVVSGRTQEEHDSRLSKLLKRFEEYGIVLNSNKCQFNVEQLEFLGHELSSKGIRPTANRVQAVKQFRRPNNTAELRSFLGLVTYVGRFIPHLARTTNLADVLSRLSVSSSEPFDPDNECYVQMLATMSAPVAITVQELQKRVGKDIEIQEVVSALEGETWPERAKPYKAYAAELCAASDLLLRGERIVIPKTLRNRILELAHEGHPGVVVMKRRLRQKVWWPGMDTETERFVKSCKDCTLVSSLMAPEPLISTKMPDKPWVHIEVDFMGPLPTGHNLLVLVDYFSRFIEVIIMKEISAKNTILAFHETFCRYGIPESTKSDNGPQFISESLQSFCTEFGIELRKTTPYWPQANGEVERANRSLKKRLQISQESCKVDWKWDLRMYLLMYNSTPHSTTGVAPSALMFGRVLRDKLPAFPTGLKKSIEEIQDEDRQKKLKSAEYADRRRKACPNALKEGDVVVAKRMTKDNKLSSNFSPEEMVVMKRNGADVKIQSKETGKIYRRNVSHLKPLTSRIEMDTEQNHENPVIPNNSGELQELTNKDTSNWTLDFQHADRPIPEAKKPRYLDDYQVGIVQDQRESGEV
ncbi:uncharacterized protein K02A2.6-like [Wyeomyia smithii]|uniref:uncharacterized protein K02A2.6-like n=1 Tax=Wyeomyia smithii TaxID=174621 RepID=UPI002467FBCF|nr:uncharacterized protein K02A2.6-like [Wyeomyia smithii]